MLGTIPLLLLAGAAHAADCDKTWPLSSLDQNLATVEQAFMDFDKQAVAKGYTLAGSQLRCLSEPLTPQVAAHFHRVTGLARFLEHQDEATRTAFAAARAIDPTYTLPAGVAPEGHPLLELYGAIDLAALPEEPLAPAATGALLHDGRPATATRRALPAIFQLVDEAQLPAWTVLVLPGDPLPAYDEAPALPPEPVVAAAPSGDTLGLAVQPPPARQPMALDKPLLAAAGVAAVASATTYGLAWKAKADWDAASDPGQLDAAYDRNHVLCITSGATLVAFAGLGVGAVLVARF